MKSKQINISKKLRKASVEKVMRVKVDRQPLTGQERDGASRSNIGGQGQPQRAL